MLLKNKALELIASIRKIKPIYLVFIGLYGVAMILGLLFFTQPDILITAGNSMLLLDGHFFDFYSAVNEQYGGYHANYYPTIFYVFSLWCLPIKLFDYSRYAAGYYQVTSIFSLIWLKILPVSAFLLSGRFFYKILRHRFDFSFDKALFGFLAYISLPTAFFAQYIFCQYDSIMLLFAVIGMYYYFDKSDSTKSMVLFSVFFAIAITMKFFVLPIFFVLLFIKRKNIKSILLYSAIAMSLILMEMVIYTSADVIAFKNSVQNFGAVTRLSEAGFFLNFGDFIIPIAFVSCFAIGWAYFSKPKDRQEMIKQASFLCNLVMFGIFGMTFFHPQWIIVVCPFLIMSTMLSKRADVFLCLDLLFMLVYIPWVSSHFENNVDQSMINNGLYKVIISGSLVGDEPVVYSHTMKWWFDDHIGFMSNSWYFSIMSCVLAINLVFKYPKFMKEDINAELDDKKSELGLKYNAILYLRLFVGLAVYAYVCMTCFGL